MANKIICLIFYLCVFVYVFTNFKQNQKKPFQIPTASYAVATFLTFNGFEGCWNAEKYYEGVAKLGISWKKFAGPHAAEFDMVLMVSHGMCHTKMWSFQSLTDIGWNIVQIDKPIYTDSNLISGNRYEHTMLLTKLYLWTLRYNLVFYLDADNLIINPLPIKQIMDNPNANVYSLGMETNEFGIGDGAGAMLITPSLKEFRKLYNAKDTEWDRTYQEQALLQKFYSPSNNRSKFALTFISPPHLPRAKNASIIHFCGNNKPWDFNACKTNDFQNYCDIWKNACNKIECL